MGSTGAWRSLACRLRPASRPAAGPGSLSGALEIRQVESRPDLDKFIRLPWRIYADDPHWVPPLLVEVRQFLDRRKHPFYRHGEAAQFLALRAGQPVGRILVSDDPRFNQRHRTNLGCFGMFESTNDPAVAHALLDAAASWLRARGRDTLRGPIDYSTNYPCGLLIEGFDSPPRVMMNHNPPYYARLLESWGLAKVKDLFAWWFTDPLDLVSRWQRRAEWLARRGRITVRSFRTEDFEAEVRRCSDMYAAAHRDNWGAVQLTEAEFQYFARHLVRVAVPEHILLAEADGKPVGFAITLPDLNEAIRPLRGRLTTFGLPIGLFRLMYRIRRVKTARMMVLVVLEGYRRRGVAELLILRTLDYGKNVLGYTTAELGWTLEDNYLINRAIEAAGGKHYKTYRIYERQIGQPPPASPGVACQDPAGRVA
ncbi:MAG: GNAT family N-acetyltransferase [Thermoguttaceae bacterium]